ncbi:MAG: FIVAR domain-containing protein [Prevotella sp.]|nr:FIVAR domain-containing protein [Prevotella sp.]
MKRRAFLFFLASLSAAALQAQVIDRITLGNAESEALHGLTTYCPDYTKTITNGLKGLTGRNCLQFDQNPFCGSYAGIYGGEYCFVLAVDGTRQNYLTLKTNGGDGVNDYERYRIQVDNKDLQDYQRDAVSFSTEKAPGGFAYSTLVLPRKATDGKTAVVIRVRSVGHYYAYGTPTQFNTYQYAMTGNMPPIYAAYTSTNPSVQLSDEPQGQLASYNTATASPLGMTLAALKTKINTKLSDAIKSQIAGGDFKPAYQNNNFNIIEAMGVAYQKGVYGTTANALAAKIRVALDSMVYINNLCKGGANITVSAIGNTATKQIASEGWGGLFGNQGYGFYLLWKAGKVTTLWLNSQVDLGNGKLKRRDQYIEAFKESFDAGCTLSGRRHITNQAMEASYSVYGAALALYALDPDTYHNAPKLAHRFIREALGLEEWTGVPKNVTFDGTLKDDDGYPTYELGDATSHSTSENFWGEHFHMMTEKGNGREEGWTCTSCYGNMGQRICDMYLISTWDPYLGSKGDEDILKMAVQNEKNQAYFAYPRADLNGHRVISGESATCWRNRYDPGRPYYNNLIVAALSDDEELMGHVWQGYLEGHVACADDADYRLFPYYQHSYYLPEAIDKLIAYGNNHASSYTPMPATPGQPDYAVGDAQDGIVAVKHGDEYLFVNFYSEMSLGSSGKAHLITPNEVRLMSFVPEVMKYTVSGQTTTAPDEYVNSNHRITYPDHPQMANGGTVYDLPAYDAEGNYNASRQICDYYQQQLGRYLIAQNTTADRSYTLVLSGTDAENQQALDIATGETVTLTEAIAVDPRTTKVYYLTTKVSTSTTPIGSPSGITTSLATRVSELTTFAQQAATILSEDDRPGYYKTTAFMPFFHVLTMSAYVAQTGDETAQTAQLTALEEAYQTFVGTQFAYNACAVPGDMDYTKKASTSGSVQNTKTSMSSAKTGAALYLPIMASETGDYTVKVKAKGHVADSYQPSLNLTLLSQEQYYNGQTDSDPLQTQLIAYSQFDYATYTWSIHLDAGKVMVLKYLFGGTSTGFVVDVGKTTIAAQTAYERLQAEILTATNLLAQYADDEAVSDASRQALQTAIDVAKAVSDSAPDADIEAAIEALQQAERLFLANVATWQYPSADQAFVKGNTSQSGKGGSFEIRNATGTDHAYVAAIKFDISKLLSDDVEVESATLRLVTVENGGDVNVHPFTANFGEAGGTTDCYAAKETFIDQAIAQDPIFTFKVRLGGGKKIFEWVPSATTTYTIADWTVTNDITNHLKQCISDGSEALSVLLAPASSSTTRSTVLSKDADANTFGTGTTDEYYLSGDNIGQKTGNKVSRWSRLLEVLANDGSPLSSLYPKLSVTLTVKDATGIAQTKTVDIMPAADVIFDLQGRRLTKEQMKSGIYIVNGKKIFVR